MSVKQKKLDPEKAVEQALGEAKYAHRDKHPEQEEFTSTALAFYKQLLVGGAIHGEAVSQEQFLNRAVEEYVAVFVEEY